MKTTFLIGNGLGMALNSETFSMEKAMENAWKPIESGDKERIRKILCKTDYKNPLKNENDLRDLQRILWYSEKSEQDNNVLKLIEIMKTFLTAVAKQFFDINSNEIVTTKFFISLEKYIQTEDYDTNLATLNYDKLLYGALIYETFRKGQLLIDGFLNKQWNPPDDKDFGWYLALHGSPLFYKKEGIFHKGGIGSIEDMEKEALANLPEHHWVLTYPHFKKDTIDKSIILTKYWEIFDTGLKKTDKFVVIGYSGNDPHINDCIRNINGEINIDVIEWDFDLDVDSIKEERTLYWQAKFNTKNIKLYLTKNILDFDLVNNLQ